MSAVHARSAPRSARFWVALTLALLVFGALCALGSWQVRRLAWKEALIAQLDRQLAAAPVAPPGPADWPALAQAQDEYRRVTLRGDFLFDREVLVQASTELGSGYWVLTPLRTEAGWWLWVNRGFVPQELKSRATRAATETAGPASVTGLLRISEPGGRLWQHNDPAHERWYSRDVAAMSAARSLQADGRAAAPYFVDASGDAAPPVWPRPGLTMLHFSNNHLVYACTWFTLAAMLAGGVVYLLRQGRRRPAADDAAPEPLSR